ncbi:hypothetical protein GCM10009592_24490 [Brachybacterium rhamnosum]
MLGRDIAPSSTDRARRHSDTAAEALPDRSHGPLHHGVITRASIVRARIENRAMTSQQDEPTPESTGDRGSGTPPSQATPHRLRRRRRGITPAPPPCAGWRPARG